MSQTFDLRPSIDAQPLVPPVKYRSGLPRGYVLTWMALAVGSLSYLSVLAVRSGDQQASVMTANAQRETALQVAQGETQKLKARLGEFQRDIAQLRGQLEVNGQDRSVIAALAAFEERFSSETGIAIAKSLPSSRNATASNVVSAPASTPTSSEAQSSSVANVASSSAASTPVSPTLLNVAPAGLGATQTAAVPPKAIPRADVSKVDAKIETGSIPVPPKPSVATGLGQPAAPIAFGPAVVKAEPKPLGVQLGSGLTLDALRLSWSVLAETNGDTLKTLTPHYSSSGTPEAGEVFDLVAGPVKSAADGKRICKALAARGVDCKVGPMGKAAL